MCHVITLQPKAANAIPRAMYAPQSRAMVQCINGTWGLF